MFLVLTLDSFLKFRCNNPSIFFLCVCASSFLAQSKLWLDWLSVCLINIDILDALSHGHVWSIFKGRIIMQGGCNLFIPHSFSSFERSYYANIKYIHEVKNKRSASFRKIIAAEDKILSAAECTEYGSWCAHYISMFSLDNTER